MQAIAHFILHPQTHRAVFWQVQHDEFAEQSLAEFMHGGGVFFDVAGARNPQPRAGFSQAVIETAQRHLDFVVGFQPAPHLRHASPSSGFESGFHLRPGGVRQFGGRTGIVSATILEQRLNTAIAIRIKPFLNGGTGTPRGRGDLLQALLALQSELDRQQTFPPPAGSFRFEKGAHAIRLTKPV